MMQRVLWIVLASVCERLLTLFRMKSCPGRSERHNKRSAGCLVRPNDRKAEAAAAAA